MERKLSGIFLIVLLVALTACVQSREKRPEVKNIGKELLYPDSTVISIIGEDIYKIVSSPSQVNVYAITPKETVEENDYEVLPHFVRSHYIGNITKSFQDVVNYILLLDSRNYVQDEVVAQTFFLPVIEFEYRKKRDRVNVVVSPNDHTWVILNNGKKVYSGNYGNKEIIDHMIMGIKNLGSLAKSKVYNSKKNN